MAAPEWLPRLPRNAWVVLGGDTLSAVGSGLTLPFFLIYLSQVRGIDVTVAGLALATVALAGFAGNPVGGWLADSAGPRPALVCGLVVSAAGAFSVSLVRESWQAFVAAALIGFGMAVVTPAQDSLLAVVVAPYQRPAVFAVRNATLNAGYGVGGVGAALVADLGSPSSFVHLYLADGVTFLVFIPVLVAMLPRDVGRSTPSTDEDRRRAGYRQVMRDGVFLRVWLLIAVLVTIGFAQTQAGFPAYATGEAALSAGAVGLAFAANTFTVVAVQLPVLRFLEGHRRTTGMALACSCWALAWALTAVVGSSGVGGTTAVLGFTAALMVFAFGETLLAPSQASLVNDLAPDELRGRYNGLYTLAWTTGLMVGPAVAGVTLDGGHGTALFAGLAVACGIAGVAATRLGRVLSPEVDLVALNRPDPDG